jgi:hypothetical protein
MTEKSYEEQRKWIEENTRLVWCFSGDPAFDWIYSDIYYFTVDIGVHGFNYSLKPITKCPKDLLPWTDETRQQLIKLYPKKPSEAAERACEWSEQKEAELIALRVERNELFESNCKVREVNSKLVADYSSEVTRLGVLNTQKMDKIKELEAEKESGEFESYRNKKLKKENKNMKEELYRLHRLNDMLRKDNGRRESFAF